MAEYFEIFEVHGIVVSKAETSRVVRLVGENGSLSKESFVKIVRGSDFFVKSFDKMGGEVTEVSLLLSISFTVGPTFDPSFVYIQYTWYLIIEAKIS